MTRNWHRRAEDGAALIIALVILTSFALTIGAIMSLGGASLAATSALRSQRSQIYAAEAAVDEAVTSLQAGQGCRFAPPTYEVPKANPVSVTVSCQPETAPPGGTVVVSVLIDSVTVLQASVVIGSPEPVTGGAATGTAGPVATAKVTSWDVSRESSTTTTTVPPRASDACGNGEGTQRCSR